MKKFFEEPTLEMTFFDAENVVTGSSDPQTAYDQAKAAIQGTAGYQSAQIVSLTF